MDHVPLSEHDSAVAIGQVRFVGRKPVQGPLSDLGLNVVLRDLRNASGKRAVDETRCSLDFGEKTLHITYIKKDEGFESDGESSTKSGEVPTAQSQCPGVEEKVIKDHVYPLSSSPIEDSASANSSSSDCESDLSKLASAPSSQSASPTAELNKYKFDHRESVPIQDVLICHTDRDFPHYVMWLVRKAHQLEAVVFECSNEGDPKALYRKFLEVSKRSKLERHRRRKSDGGSVMARSVEAILSQASRKSDKTRSVIFDSPDQPDLGGDTVQQRLQSLPCLNPNPPHTSGSAHVTQSHQRRSVGLKSPGGRSRFAQELETILSRELDWRREHPEGANQVVLPPPTKDSPSAGLKVKPKGESLSLRQRAPALFLRKLEDFEQLTARSGGWSKLSTDIMSHPMGASPNSPKTSASSHSRSPQLFPATKTPQGPSSYPHRLKFDIRNEPAHRNYNPHRADTNASSHFNASKEPASLKTQITISGPSIMSMDVVTEVGANLGDRPPGDRTTHSTPSSPRNRNPAEVPRSARESRRSPPTGQPGKNPDKVQPILVPTKTGKEPVKKLYPKEPNLDMNRNGRVTFPGLQPQLNGLSGMQFAAQQFAAQPHSLPMFPVQMAWTMDQANNVHPVFHTPQWAGPPGSHLGTNLTPLGLPGPSNAPGLRSRSRDRQKIDPELKRRAQSKSPARRPTSAYVSPSGHKPRSDPPSLDFSKKIRELGEAFRQKMAGRRMVVSTPVARPIPKDVPDVGPMQLKSNLKKQVGTTVPADASVSPRCGSSPTLGHSCGFSNSDGKKVHFNKFATVQMLE